MGAPELAAVVVGLIVLGYVLFLFFVLLIAIVTVLFLTALVAFGVPSEASGSALDTDEETV